MLEHMVLFSSEQLCVKEQGWHAASSMFMGPPLLHSLLDAPRDAQTPHRPNTAALLSQLLRKGGLETAMGDTYGDNNPSHCQEEKPPLALGIG